MSKNRFEKSLRPSREFNRWFFVTRSALGKTFEIKFLRIWSVDGGQRKVKQKGGKKERKKGRKEGRKKEIKAWNEIERETEKWNGEKWKKEKESGSPIRGYERFGIKDGIKGMRKIDTGMLLKMHCPRQLRPHLLRVFTLNRSLLVHWTRQLFHEVMEG